MVNYIESSYPFYATDHCGILRINNPDILPHYFALALQVEGEYEKFSRSNRASTQRIKNLTIQIPDKKIKKKILTMLQKFSEDIHYDRLSLSDIDKKSRKLLVSYLGDICYENHIIAKLLRIAKNYS